MTTDEYLQLLEKHRQIVSYYNEQFESLAENSRFLRRKSILKKYQKDLEKRRKVGLAIWDNDVKKQSGGQVVINEDKPNKQNKFICWIKKLFHKEQAIVPPDANLMFDEAKEADTTVSQPDSNIIDGQLDMDDLEQESEEPQIDNESIKDDTADTQ